VQLDAALDKLAASSGPIKQRLLMAAAHVVSADGVLLTAGGRAPACRRRLARRAGAPDDAAVRRLSANMARVTFCWSLRLSSRASYLGRSISKLGPAAPAPVHHKMSHLPHHGCPGKGNAGRPFRRPRRRAEKKRSRRACSSRCWPCSSSGRAACSITAPRRPDDRDSGGGLGGGRRGGFGMNGPLPVVVNRRAKGRHQHHPERPRDGHPARDRHRDHPDQRLPDRGQFHRGTSS
jgi:hypothetical protein